MAAASAMAALGTIALAAPSSGAARASATSRARASSVTRSTVTFAELPSESPNFIFPFLTAAFYGVENLTYLQHYLFRPLYWYGKRGSVGLDKTLSIAKTPVLSDGNRKVTVTLKNYKWSDGTPVTSTDVLFWLNIWKSNPSGFGAWFSDGLSLPTSVKSFVAKSPQTFTITFDTPYNPTWLQNELALVTPLPVAWTKTTKTQKAGSAGCATAAFGTKNATCKAVDRFLSEQAGYDPTDPKATINALPTYATNPLWKVVDGPWHLTSFGPTQPAVFQPNPAYSGPNKPKIKKFVDLPFTTNTAEFNALVSGRVDIGYLPVTDVTSDAKRPGGPGRPLVPGTNNHRLISTYSMVPRYPYRTNYFPENFESTGDGGQAGKIFSQLYFRQAFQDLIDQPLYIKRIFKGYGFPTYGPVPSLPKNPYAAGLEMHNPYPYNPSKAVHLLSSHGWKVVPNGTSTCERAGTSASECGRGVKKGAKLSFTLLYAFGTQGYKNLMTAEKASWSAAGIDVTLRSASYDDVIGVADPCSNLKSCPWEMGNWLAGWTFTGSYPTGQAIFASGSPSNSGSFTTAVNDRLIKKTVTSPVSLTAYENYLAKMLPAVWQPTSVTLLEIHKGLRGASPASPLFTLTPATFSWK